MQQAVLEGFVWGGELQVFTGSAVHSIGDERTVLLMVVGPDLTLCQAGLP